MWVDEMAWLAASHDYPDCKFVTVGMDAVEFKKSVREGSILEFTADKIRQGETSVTYSVIVRRDDEEIFSTAVTLVRVDSEGEKQCLPI